MSLSFLHLSCLFLLAPYGFARAAPQEQPKQALGSLTSVGEVDVSDSAAPAESTIFSGDTLRTGENGTATFTSSGKGSLKVLPLSEVIFVGDYRFTAELKKGKVILTAISGPNGVTLRVGNSVLVSSIRQQSATTRVEQTANGSFLVSCLDGGVGVLTIEGKSGQFLQAGQSLTLSSSGAISPLSFGPNTQGHSFHGGWLYLGLAGAGAAGALAGLARGQGNRSISPSAP